MDSSNLIPILRNYKVKHQNQYGIARLGLFGSVVRNEAQKLSDIDVNKAKPYQATAKGHKEED